MRGNGSPDGHAAERGHEQTDGRVEKRGYGSIDGRDHNGGHGPTDGSGASHGHHVFYGYVVVGALIAAIAIPLSCAVNAAGIFYTSLAKEFGTSSGTLSYYTSFLWGAGLISLPFMGKLLDRLPARVCVSGSCLLIALGFVWLSFMTELWQYFLGAFVMGFGVTMLNLMAPSTIINRWFAKRAGLLIGIAMAFTGVGGLVFSSVGGALILSIGWSKTYLVFAGLSAVTIPITWLLIKSRPSDMGLEPFGKDAGSTDGMSDGMSDGVTTTDSSGESDGASSPDSADAMPSRSASAKHGDAVASDSSCLTPLEKAELGGIQERRAFRMLPFYLILALAFIMNFCMYTYYIIPSYADSLTIGIAFPMLGSLAASAAMGAQTVSKLGMGGLSSKVPILGTCVCFAIGICGIVTLALGSSSIALVFAGAVGYGIFHGTVNVMLPEFTKRSFGDRDYARIYAWVSMSACAANIANGLICGTILHVTGDYAAVFIGLAVLLGIGGVLVWMLRKRSILDLEKGR